MRYSTKELGKVLSSFNPANCVRLEVSNDNEIEIGDIVTKKYDPHSEKTPFVVYKSWMKGGKLCARNGFGGDENVDSVDWYLWKPAEEPPFKKARTISKFIPFSDTPASDATTSSRVTTFSCAVP